MRKFAIGQKVMFEHLSYGLVNGEIVDKKYIYPFTQYAVRSTYIHDSYREDNKLLEHIDWFFTGEIVTCGLIQKGQNDQKNI